MLSLGDILNKEINKKASKILSGKKTPNKLNKEISTNVSLKDPSKWHVPNGKFLCFLCSTERYASSYVAQRRLETPCCRMQWRKTITCIQVFRWVNGKKKSTHNNQIKIQSLWYRESVNCLERTLDKHHSLFVPFLCFTPSIYYFPPLECAKPSIPMI